jgi:hypothetical protein
MQNEETPTEVNPFLEIASSMYQKPAQPVAQPDNPFMELAPSMRALSQPPAIGSLSAVMGINPDQAAEATKLGKPLGIGQDLGLRNMEELRRRSMIASVQRSGMLQNNPRFAESLLDPVFAAQAHDDLDSLNKTSSLFDTVASFLDAPNWFFGFKPQADIVGGAERGMMVVERGELASRQMFGSATPADVARLEFLDKRLGAIPSGGIVSMTAEVVAQQLATARSVGTTALAGAAAGGAVLGPKGAAAGFVSFGAGGLMATTTQTEAGNLYRDMVNEGVDPDTAQYAALTGGLLNGIIELAGAKIAAGPFKTLATKFIKESVDAAIAKPTTRAAMAIAGKEYTKQVGTNTAEEVGQELVAIASEEIAKAMDGIDSETSFKDAMTRLVDAGIAGFQGSLVLGGIGPTANFVVDVKRADVAAKQQEFFDGLDAAKKDGKLPKRNLDAYEGFLASQAKGTTADTVYVEAEAAAQVLAQSGLSVTELEKVLPGIREQLQNALENGGDITIPTAVYGAKLSGTQLGDALRPHMRLSPEAMSVAQAQEFSRKRDALRQEAQAALAERQEADAAFVESAQKVETTVAEQLRQTGMQDIEVRANAELFRDLAVTQAARMGITPEQFYERYPYRVRGPQAVQEGQPLEQARGALSIEQFEQAERQIGDGIPEDVQQAIKQRDEFIRAARQRFVGKPNGRVRAAQAASSASAKWDRENPELAQRIDDARRPAVEQRMERERKESLATDEKIRSASDGRFALQSELDSMLKRAGFALEYTSDYGSRYYTHPRIPEDRAVRVSDHELPSGNPSGFVYANQDRYNTPRQEVVQELREWLAEHGLSVDVPKLEQAARIDADYMAAVERGDMATAQRMVDEAARVQGQEAVTRDEQGNVVPLSRRFDITSPKVFEQAAMFEQAPVSPGFYSALAKAVDAIDAKSIAPSGWKERIKGLVNKGEVKQDEVNWSGLTDWLDMQEGKVTKEAVAEFLKNNGVRVKRVQRSGKTTTKFGQYTLPGGTNYREVLITLPSPTSRLAEAHARAWRKYGQGSPQEQEAQRRLDEAPGDSEGFRSSHWKQPNVLVHFRLNDRVDADGKRVLFVEEIQSDWGQAGRKKGFASPMLSTLPAGTKLYEPGTSPYDATMAVVELPVGIVGRSLFYGNTIDEAKANALAFIKPVAVPLAPFVETTDGWLALALKHIMLEATQGNYDRVAFINGKQSADRYDLSKQVSLLSVNKQADGRYLTYIEGVDGSPLFRNRDGFSESGQKVMTAEELADTVGKDVADQAINGKPNKDGWVDVRGDGLKVGGKGMIEFYDKIVPAAVNKLLKKYGGGKLGAVVIPGAQTELRNGEIRFGNAEDVDEFLTEMSIRGFEDEDYGRVDDTMSVSFAQLNGDAFDAFSRAAKIYNGVVEVKSVGVVSADVQQQPGFTVTPEMVKKLESGLPLFQAARAPRGDFDPAKLMTTLREGRDFSTFAHETAHLYLTILADIARSATGPQQLKADMDALLRWFGIEGATPAERLAKWSSLTIDQQRQYHEQFAYSFEIYLHEGKAPSVEMQSLFNQFSAWLKRVYKSIRDELNATYKAQFGRDLPMMNSEIRLVMDRMLATDEQIARAQAVRGMKAMFQTQEQSGMNDAEWAAYQALEQDATDAATAELTKATLKELQWYSNAQSKYLREMQSKHDRARKEIREEVSAQVQLEPVYRAMELLKRGVVRSETGETATAAGISKLDLATVKAIMPADFDPASLKYGKYGMVQEGGLHPDIVAEVYGFGSGVELINALLAAKPIKDEINARTDQRMLDENSDLATPEARQAAVDMAIHNEARARFIAVEQRWLEKQRRPANDMLQAARQVAQDIIGDVVIRTLNPRRYEAAEAEAARTATTAYREPQDPVTAGRAAETKAYNEAIAAGQTPFEATVTSTQAGVEASVKATERLEEFRAKYGGREPAEVARRAKRQQLVQNQLAREAMLAKEEIDKQVKYLRRVLRDTNVKRMGAEAADQIAQMLERFEVARVSIKRLDERKALSAYLAAQEEAGLVPDIAPEIANEARRINYREMTVNQFRDLVDAVRQIEHVAKYERKMRLAQELADFEETRDGIVARIRAVAAERGLQIDPRTPLTNIGRTAAALRGFAAQHLKAASIVRILDGGEDDGPLWNAIIRTANDASNMETTMRSVAAMKIGEILKPVFALGNMGGKGMFFSTIQRSLNREARIAIAMNVGNDGNRQRLLDGEGWTMEQIQPILESLTEAEWLAVQAVWDFIDGYRPEIAAKERRLYGKEPQWVEPVPFTVRTADGKNLTLQGGYYPIKYDPVASDRVATIDAVEEAKRDLQGSYTAATTRRSFTKQRATEVVGRPLLYTLDAAFTGVNDVIHDLAWHEWLISTQRLLRNEKFANAVRETRGPEFLKQLRDWAKDNATGGRGQQAAGEAVLSWLRQGISASGLGFNVVSAAMQITGFNQSIIRVGAKYIGWGITEFVSDIPGAAKRVAEKDPFMAERGRTQFREINEIKNRVRGQTDIGRRVTSGTYFLMMTMQRAVDIPTWLGAYQKALDAGKDDATAVALAGQAVRDSQGSGLLADLAAVERGGPAMKLFTVFYSYMNTVYNMAAVQTMTARARGKLAADYVMLFVVPVVLGYAIKNAIQPEPDDEEFDPEALARDLAAAELEYMMGTMIIVREFSGASKIVTGAEGVRMGYSGPAGLRLIGEAYTFTNQAAQLEFDRAFRKSAINLLGALTGIPSAQINRTIDGIDAVVEEEVEGGEAVLAPLTGVKR